jgi:hypothetical protein
VEAVAGIPTWLVGGIALGALASVAIAALFVLVDRFLPGGTQANGTDGETVRRRECRDYLRTIDERFLEDHDVASETVAFYLPERAVAVTFDPRAYYRLEGSPVTPILLEHEVPGRTLGRRLPFETPEPVNGPDRTDPVRQAYAELGLSPTADAAAVSRAYRERVPDAHPDQGGDEAAFRRLREAYTTAKRHASDD